ncbi:hypothetical protein Mp_2g26090 [Marchantia polymorpha subsp. ruderalis]|uniref:Reverse transcriptase n=1 Tax=Marchantia polymorpha TaxID=3197 RepID=A0A2R6XBH1_MARPO|nr:hypothetical protein MARPO_0025s0070 [Marchantia polymorpha]BBN03753.1 hypothetical protein Mp_2g26090 [Marchantia polymorpha subsp. ruderalis]|eukprot:PTQ43379.1 hypothetical protein MARPO_0025s0070 [Marchantia polymorpha]
MRPAPPSDTRVRTEVLTSSVKDADVQSSVVMWMATTILRSPLFSTTELMDSDIDLARVFRVVATSCERGRVTATSAEIRKDTVEELFSTSTLFEETTWQAATARMKSLPARPAIDRESIVPGVCMVDNMSGLFCLVSSTRKVCVPVRVLLDSGAQSLMLGKAACISLGIRRSELEPCPFQIQTSLGGASDRSNFMTRESIASYDVFVGGAVLYPMGFWMDYWTETAAYRHGWQSSDGRLSELASGILVRRYLYVEKDETARRVSSRHVAQLMQRFTSLLPRSAVRGYQKALPTDISLLGAPDLDRVGHIDMVIAGWPCQGHTRAGHGTGLHDPRSRMFWKMMRVLRHLQVHQTRSLAYILEKVPLLGDTRAQLMAIVHKVRAWIGSAVLLDAVRVGSRAHRARLWWTNLLPREILRHAYDSVQRDPTLTVDSILDVSRHSQVVRVDDRSPMALMNRVGQPRMALPTFVNYPASHAYRDGGPGLLPCSWRGFSCGGGYEGAYGEPFFARCSVATIDSYAYATVMPVKKDVNDNYTDRRMCGDYRPINRQTKSDKYAMPTPEEIFDVVEHGWIFSTLDLRAGYHQLPIREEDKIKTAFWGVNSHGKDCLYRWRFLPFGLKNAPAEFQRVMDRILAGLDFVRCYIYDILVCSDTVEQHQIHLQIVFERLRAHGLRLHPGKCKFFQEKVEYLGHVIYPGGLGVQLAKVEAIARIPRSTDVSRVRAFMGLANYYWMYVKEFSAIAKPLNQLLKSDQEWQRGDEQERAFVELKAKLVAAPILRRPIRGRPYQLHTYWSMLGLGAVWTQRDDEGKEFVVVYASRSNNATDTRYSLYKGECLAAVWAVAHFRCYLFGTQFTLVTDHQPLKWLMESEKLTGKLARWALILQEYDFQVVHRPGVENLYANGLSQNPCTRPKDDTGARLHDEVHKEMVHGWHASAFMCWLYPEVEDGGVD